jgi:ankyrin repeat protein
MKRILILMVMSLIIACGGPQYVVTPDYSPSKSYEPDGIKITRGEYPDLYKSLEDDSYIHEGLLGSFSKMTTSEMNVNGEKTYFIKTSDGSRDTTWESILYFAFIKSDKELTEKAISKVQSKEALSATLQNVLSEHSKFNDFPAIMKLLLARGASPDAKTRSGKPLLHLLIANDLKMQDSYSILKMLLEAGADVNVQDSDGYTSLHVMLSEYIDVPNRVELLRMFLDLGADVNLPHSSGGTPLHMVLSGYSELPGRVELFRILLDAGADVNKMNANGVTPLLGVLGWYEDPPVKGVLVKALIEAGADTSARDKEGVTVLHKLFAGASGEEGIIGEDTIISVLANLTGKGYDLDSRCTTGRTPLNHAYFGGMDETVVFLLQKGAKDYGIRNSYEESIKMNTTILGLGSFEIATLEKKQCYFILDSYGVKYEGLTGYKGVDFPVILKSKVGGVKFSHTGGNKKFSVMDCRLAVALVAWSPILNKHKVKEIEHMRAYAPGSKIGGRGNISFHSYALALDPAHYIYEDGTRLAVKEHWTERNKSEGPCYALEVKDRIETKEQAMLRELICDTGNIDLFSVILTPHYNKAHHDHVHVELNPAQHMFVQ